MIQNDQGRAHVAEMETAFPSLDRYLEDIAFGLKALGGRRRHLILRELHSHFLDEAECRGITSDAAMREMLLEKDAPETLARQISQSEGHGAFHRGETALLLGALLGCVTGGYLFFLQGWAGSLALFFGIAYGFVVGSGTLLLRHRWQRMNPWMRTLLAILLGAVLAIPLGFTGRSKFIFSRVLYGAFTGHLVERHATPRPPWQVILEILTFTLIDFSLICWLYPRYHFNWVAELAFNFALTLAVLVALNLKRILAERWMLAHGEDW